MSSASLAVAMTALNEIKSNSRCECGDAEYRDPSGKVHLCAGLYDDGTPFYCPKCTASEALDIIRADRNKAAEAEEFPRSGAV